MALQLILGNSGSGKTEYLFGHIVEEASKNPFKNYLVIVPEQFTLQTQKKLVELSSNKAIMNIDILSFKRLAYRIFDELGLTTVKVLDETGKNLVLRKVANEVEDQLSVLKSNMNRIGYINELKSLLSEFVQYNITPEELRDYVSSGKLSSSLAAKLSDVAVMYDGYNAFMKERYTTSEELLNVLKDVIEESAILKDSIIAFDGFTGFTPIQNQLLYKLFQVADDILVSLTIDGKEDFFHSKGMQELFDMPKKCIETLYKIAQDTKIEVKEPIVFNDSSKVRYKNSADLAFLEKNLFRRTYQRSLTPPEDVSIYSMQNPSEEIIRVARRINALVQKEGYRYSELAVVTGDVPTYGNYVENVFRQYHIPYYLDKTTDIVFHPFVEFIKSTLDIIKMDFSYETVFHFLRTGFVDIDVTDIDILENYILATGIRGKSMWGKKFTRMARNTEFDVEHLDELRILIMDILLPVYNCFHKKDVTVIEELTEIYNLIIKLDIERKLNEKEKEFLLDNQEIKAKQYGQIYKSVMQIFEKYVALLGTEKLSLEEFIEILNAGLDASAIATIPPSQDSVTVGDIERSRLDQVKILFFVGVNDGVIPKNADRGGIISSYDREALKELDMVLAPGAREQSFMQRYYLYLNLTKPEKSIEISYSRTDALGKVSRPSYLISVIKRMFAELKEEYIDDIHQKFDYSTKEAALDYLVNVHDEKNWFDIANYFLHEKEYEERTKRLLQAPFECHEDASLRKEVANAIYGDVISGSVTRLEQYAQCAYKHYLMYGLHLKEREESGFMSADIGNIYHEAICQYSRKLEKSVADWFTISDMERIALAKESFDEAVLNYPAACVSSSFASAHEVERMEKVFQQTIWALTKQVRAGHFVPTEFEISFNKKEDIEALHFELENGCSMNLGGRIDRLDLCKDDGKVYVKIIDYKSGSTTFDLAKIYQGTQLQLVVYMNAAMELVKKENSFEVEPAGIFYYHIDNPQIEISGSLEEDVLQEEILKKLRPDGVLNASEEVIRNMDEDFEKESLVVPVAYTSKGELAKKSKVLSDEEFSTIQDYVSLKVKQMGQEMFDGNIQINPRKDTPGKNSSKTCEYCPYKGICRINSNIPGFALRKAKLGEKELLLEEMQKELALSKEK